MDPVDEISGVRAFSSEESEHHDLPDPQAQLMEQLISGLQNLAEIKSAVSSLSSEVKTLRAAHEHSLVHEYDAVEQPQRTSGPSAASAASNHHTAAPVSGHAPTAPSSFLTAPLTSLGHRATPFFQRSALQPPVSSFTAEELAPSRDWLSILKPPAIKSWDGKSDPEEWLLDTESILLSLLPPGTDLQELDRAVPRVVLKLEGLAKNWWIEWRSRLSTYPTWEEFKAKALELQLVDKVKLAREKLATMRQTGSIPDYVSYMNKITLQIPGLSDEEKYYRFKEGLKPNMKRELEKVIALYGGKTLQEAIQYLQALELIDRDRAPRPQSDGKPSSDRNRQRGRWGRGNSTSDSRASERHDPSPRSVKNSNSNGSPSPGGPSSSTNSHSSLTCHLCGKKGHIRPNCPQNKDSNPRSGGDHRPPKGKPKRD